MVNRYERNCDEALIDAIRRGDADAAACLYHRYIDRVHRICYRIVLDPAQVPDCVQEVWLKVFRNIGRFRRNESFGAWLKAIAANTAIDCYRRRKCRGVHIDLEEVPMELLSDEGNRDGQPLDGVLVRRRVQEALAEISVSQRTAFVLRYFEEMPLPQIARVLGCRQGTVRTHIRRCILALRAKLADEFNEQR
jgi:RNA polymerase sigma-70 factor, ECF subfamily